MKQVKANYLYDLFYTLNPILFLTAFVLFSLYVNEIVIRFRLQEFDLGLRALSNKENVNHSSNILARIKLITDRINNPEQEEINLRDEIKYHTIAADEITSPMNIQFNPADKIVIQMIQGLRYILGKKVQVFYSSEGNQKKIEEAYFYERSRKYHTAIKIYTELLKQNWPPGTRSTLLLHLSFCQAMTGNNQRAMKTLSEIMDNKEYNGTENWKISWKIFNELKILESRSKELQEKKLSLLETGKEMFRLGNYLKASEYLGQELEKAKGADKLEGLYYLGRTHEEKGQFEEALKFYSMVLRESPESLWAQKANRRLYVMGKFYNKNEKLAEIAKKNSKIFGDTSIIQDLEVFEKIEEVKKPKVVLEPVLEKPDRLSPVAREDTSQAVPVKIDSSLTVLKSSPVKKVDSVEIKKTEKILSVLDSISIPDLEQIYSEANLVRILKPEGEKVEVVQEKLIPKKILLNDSVRTAQIFNLVRARSGELQYTYDKWRRKGMVGSGKLTLKLLISNNGMVKKAQITKIDISILNQHFENEIISKVKNWKFGENKKSTEDISFSFPVSFISKDKRSVFR